MSIECTVCMHGMMLDAMKTSKCPLSRESLTRSHAKIVDVRSTPIRCINRNIRLGSSRRKWAFAVLAPRSAIWKSVIYPYTSSFPVVATNRRQPISLLSSSCTRLRSYISRRFPSFPGTIEMQIRLFPRSVLSNVYRFGLHREFEFKGKAMCMDTSV